MMEEAVKKNMEIKEDKILSLQSRLTQRLFFCIKKNSECWVKAKSFVLFQGMAEILYALYT